MEEWGVLVYGGGRGVRLSSGLYMFNTLKIHPRETHPLPKIFVLWKKKNWGRSTVKCLVVG